MDLNSAVQNLENTLVETKEFNELRNRKAELNRDPKTSLLVSNFEEKQKLLQNPKLSQEQMKGIMDDLNSDYERLSTIPQIKNYFNAVDGFNQLVNNIMFQLNSNLEKRM